jgi:hypothetical protein
MILGAMASCHVCASVTELLLILFMEWQSYFIPDPYGQRNCLNSDGVWVKRELHQSFWKNRRVCGLRIIMKENEQ